MTIVDFSVTVPVLGDTFNISYAPIIRGGSQVSGAGKIFEVSNDIDFSNPFSTTGVPNRIVIPNLDSNGNIVNYTLTKREIVINGSSKIFKKVINPSDVVPFLEVILPDDDVISIDSVITLKGSDFLTLPNLSDFINLNNRWFEMDALAEDKVFIEDNSIASDNSSVKPGKWISVNRKFIREYTDLGFTRIIFGGGTQDTNSLSDFDTNKELVNQIGDFINNMALGIIPTANTTMFIKYRVGGGLDSNVGPNTITSLGVISMDVNGSDNTLNAKVKNSLKVNNLFPALGGKEVPSVEEIRNLVRYNFASQNRAVTIKDYVSRIGLMPGNFGVPFRYGVFEEQNKIKVYILSLDSNSKLTNSSTSILRDNISAYLSDFRMLNDYVEITNGRIINLGFQIDLIIDKKLPQVEIISQVITVVSSYFDINKYQMGENIYLSSLIEQINNVGGVLNVIDIRVYNKIGEGLYSLNEIAQPYLDPTTRQVDVGDFTLFGDPVSMFEIKNPNIDILCRVR